jgi:predicted metalloprotease
MEWTPGGSGQDVEDRRDESGGGGGGSGFGFGHLGIGGILIVGLLSLVFHQNFFALLSNGGGGAGAAQGQVQSVPDPQRDQAEAKEVDLMKAVLNDDQSNWDQMLPAQAHIPYHHAKLVLFRDSTPSACGMAQDATGPFYCPQDEKVYLDLGFFDELKNRFGGSNAEFAQAYVVAHELGHHVQKLLGTEAKVRAAEEQNPGQQNALSVAMELQADCFAGVWGNSAKDRLKLNQSDIAAALSAAAAVGDDRLQKMATGTVNPEKFTHGSAAQRTAWFTKGFQTGSIAACNTFGQ